MLEAMGIGPETSTMAIEDHKQAMQVLLGDWVVRCFPEPVLTAVVAAMKEAVMLGVRAASGLPPTMPLAALRGQGGAQPALSCTSATVVGASDARRRGVGVQHWGCGGDGSAAGDEGPAATFTVVACSTRVVCSSWCR